MKDVKSVIDIDRSAQKVFNFIIDPANTPKWVASLVREETNETPVKLGTIYKNQDRDGNWSEFEISAFEPGAIFELTKKADSTHVKYSVKPVGDDNCELEYRVSVEEGNISERFSEDKIRAILHKLKQVIEQS